jgi:4-amino-4-deoxy-L-arabinose transferase-like glycosyltransferase
MVPLGLLGKLVSPVDVPVWREAVVFVGAVLVGLAMFAMAGSLRVRRPWARPVTIVVLATWTLVIGAFIFAVFRSDEGHGAVYVLLGGLQLGGLAAAGVLGLATRGAAADFRARGNDALVLPEPPPPVT